MMAMVFTDLPPLETVFDWIELHKTTVDLLKWAMLLLVAWIAGVFKFLRMRLRRPSIAIVEDTSRCLIEELSKLNGYSDVLRATLLVEVGVLNPTNERINVKGFTLAVARRRYFKRWKREQIASSLPSRPRFQTGSGMKISQNWFSKFPDEYQEATITSVIEPKEFPSGYLLFVLAATGNAKPKIEDGHVFVKARVNLTTGESFRVSGKIKIVLDSDLFESWLPGINDHISHDSVLGSSIE